MWEDAIYLLINLNTLIVPDKIKIILIKMLDIVATTNCIFITPRFAKSMTSAITNC